MSYQSLYIGALLLCVVYGQQSSWPGSTRELQSCSIGEPLLDNSGTAVYCGRGGHRQDCPPSHICVVHPSDYWAVCCTRGNGTCTVQYQLAHQQSLVGSYIPNCEEDGSYSPLQCYGSTGQCWCVMANGTEIQQTRSYPGEPQPKCEPETATDNSSNETLNGTVDFTDKPVFCELPFDQGPCETAMERWYFDTDKQQCMKFTYGGCDGNQNNFQDKMSCENMCHSKEDVLCPNYQVWNDCGSLCDKICQDPDPQCGSWCTARCECPPNRPILHQGQCINQTQCPTTGNNNGSLEIPIPAYCKLPADKGPCQSSTIRWYYHPVWKQCYTFTYGGCDGNQNNFQDQLSCQNLCKVKDDIVCPDTQVWTDCGSPCTKTCDNRSPMCAAVCQPRCQCPASAPYVHEGKCTSESKCPVKDVTLHTTTLKPTTPVSCPASVLCRTHCTDGYKNDKNGCQTCECVDLCEDVHCWSNFECTIKVQCITTSNCTRFAMCMQSRCLEMYDPGPCRVREDAWHYDSQAGKCDMFQYGGCEGNGNRFSTQQGCESFCTPSLDIPNCPAVKCDLTCKNGLRKDQYGCNVCECNTESNSTCLSVDCPESCSYGQNITMDDNGCRICSCLDPCQNISCNNVSICVVTPGLCQNSTCLHKTRCITNKCLQSQDSGSCKARKPRYFYNRNTSVCELFYYGGCFGNENNFITKDICMSTCTDTETVEKPTTCPPMMCRMHCDHGFKQDSKGCDICECHVPPKPTCPMVICTMHCDGGFIKDTNGCDICLCQEIPRPTCPPLKCDKTCFQGHQVDNNGCDICECKWDFCSNITCDINCTNSGYVVDRGCAQCRCNDPCENFNCNESYSCETKTSMMCTPSNLCHPEPICIPSICVKPKETGPCRARKPRYYYNTNTSQCELLYYGGCFGNENNFITKDICMSTCMDTKIVQKPTCPPMMCRMHCDHGFKQDTKGCDICECHEPPTPTCQMVICTMHCDGGFIKDTNGCDICLCQEIPRPTCPPLKCDKTCFQGHKVDNNGCDICECKWDFCSNKTCDINCTHSGYFVDMGCAQCRCNDPCEDYNCPPREVCVQQIAQCLRAPCHSLPRCVPDVSSPSRCLQAKEAGTCSIMRRMWFYNQKKKECETFMYSGCGGNQNKFPTRDACIGECTSFGPVKPTCQPEQCPVQCSLGFVKQTDDNGCVTSCTCKCPELQCTHPCMSGYKKDRDNCDTCKCAPPPCPTCGLSDYCEFGHMKDQYGCDICEKCFEDPCKDYQLCNKGQECAAKTVECNDMTCETNNKTTAVCVSEVASICKEISFNDCLVDTSIWFYNKFDLQCVQITAKSPCPGSQNRFTSKLDCLNACRPVTCPRPLVPLPHCKFGHKNDTDGCKVSECNEDPCSNKPCAGNTICQPVVKPDCKNNCYMDFVCSDIHNKSGVCPTSSTVFENLCGETCTNDIHCPRQMKCCDTGCGHMCIPAVRQDNIEPLSYCMRQQQSALLSLNNEPLNPTTVPMCNVEQNQFEPVQCNLHLGLCWCQDPKTGNKIQGTQIRGIPDCTNMTHGRPVTEKPVCPVGVPVQKCVPLLCSQHLCLGHPKAQCRVNPCGDNCTVEFYDKNGILLNYESDCIKGLSSCQNEQLSTYKAIWMSMKMQILYSPNLGRDFTKHYMKLHRHITEQSMTLHGRRQQDVTGPARPDGGPVRQGERGLADTGPGPLTGPRGVIRGNTSRGEQGRPVGGAGNAHMPQLSHGHDPLPMPVDTYVPKCRGLHQHFHGGYEFKQCSGQYCWCVDDSGSPITGTLTPRMGLLTCTETGENYQLSSEDVSCPSGTSPSICVDVCNKRQCLGYTGQVHCIADPCNNCNVQFYTEDWNLINSCQTPMPSAICDNQCGWHYSKVSNTCLLSNTCTSIGGLSSKQQCSMICQSGTLCPDGMSNLQCSDTCPTASCPMFPESVCVMDWCTCTHYFVDPDTQVNVNCTKGVGMCHRHQSAYLNMNTLNGNRISSSLVTPQCDTAGNFMSEQCAGEHCWCVDRAGHILQPHNEKCEVPAILKIQLKLIFNNSYEQIANPSVMKQFKSLLVVNLARFLHIKEASIRVVKVIRGSIIAVVDVLQSDSETSTKIDILKKAIISDSINITLNGQPLHFDRSQPINVTYVYHQASTTAGNVYPEITTKGTEMNHLEISTKRILVTNVIDESTNEIETTQIYNSTDSRTGASMHNFVDTDKIIIIVAAVLLTVFLVIMLSLILCKRKSKTQKVEEDFSTSKVISFNNPVYGKPEQNGAVKVNGVSYA